MNKYDDNNFAQEGHKRAGDRLAAVHAHNKACAELREAQKHGKTGEFQSAQSKSPVAAAKNTSHAAATNPPPGKRTQLTTHELQCEMLTIERSKVEAYGETKVVDILMKLFSVIL